MAKYTSYSGYVLVQANRSPELRTEIKKIKKEYRSEELYLRPWFVFLFTAAMAVLDGVVMTSLTDTVLTQSYGLSILLTVAIACVLNFSCMPIGVAIEKIIHERGSERKKNIGILISLLIVFFMVFSAVSIARLHNSDTLYKSASEQLEEYTFGFDEEDDTTLQVVDESETAEGNGKIDWATMSFTILLILEPLGTSVLAAILSIMASDCHRDRLKRAKINCTKTEIEVLYLENALQRLRSFDPQLFLEADSGEQNALSVRIDRQAEYLRARQAHVLGYELKDPSILSK